MVSFLESVLHNDKQQRYDCDNDVLRVAQETPFPIIYTRLEEVSILITINNY